MSKIKTNKTIATLLMAGIMIFSLAASPAATAYAAESGESAAVYELDSDTNSLLRYTNIKYATYDLSFNNGKANCVSSVTGYTSNTNYVSLVMTLYKLNGSKWELVDSWETSANTYTVTLNKSASVSSGTYKLCVTFTAGSESDSKEIQRTY